MNEFPGLGGETGSGEPDPEREMLACEQALLHGDFRASPDELALWFTAGFREVTPFGGVSDAQDVALWLLNKDPERRWEFSEFEVRELAPGLRLVSYHARQSSPPRPDSKGARHASLWRFSPELARWQLYYHQSTRVA